MNRHQWYLEEPDDQELTDEEVEDLLVEQAEMAMEARWERDHE